VVKRFSTPDDDKGERAVVFPVSFVGAEINKALPSRIATCSRIPMKYISKLSLLTLLQFFVVTAFADSLHVSKFDAHSAQYLDAKSAFCYTQESLSQYLDAAKQSDIESMNHLVLNGKCDFVPDGQVYSVKKFSSAKIGTTPVIAFNKDETTLWTFKAFVNSVNFNVDMP
jgi:hypothetical protein